MTYTTRPRPNAMAASFAPQRRGHAVTVARIVAVSVLVSELITIVLTKVLLGEVLEEGMLIALICAAPISTWIADRQLRMRHVISEQHDQLSALNVELNARNDDLDSFARAVAHDLRTPLASIIGLAEVLASDPRLDRDRDIAASIRSILESGDNAAQIIDGLLLLHGIQHDVRDLAPVDAATTFDTALALLGDEITIRGATVTRSIAAPLVLAHGPWLVQVWTNLIGNAIKYGGSPPEVNVASYTAELGMIRFEIVDNGSGIPPEDRNRLFHEFERGKDTEVDGHGLGLAIVSKVVARLGGSVGAESTPDGGGLFWFTVPAA